MSDYYDRLKKRSELDEREDKVRKMELEALAELWRAEKERLHVKIDKLEAESYLKDMRYDMRLEHMRRDVEYLDKLYASRQIIIEAEYKLQLSHLKERFDIFKEISSKDYEILERIYGARYELQQTMMQVEGDLLSAHYYIKLADVKGDVIKRQLEDKLSEVSDILDGIRKSDTISKLEEFQRRAAKVCNMEEQYALLDGMERDLPQVGHAYDALRKARESFTPIRKQMARVLSTKNRLSGQVYIFGSL